MHTGSSRKQRELRHCAAFADDYFRVGQDNIEDHPVRDLLLTKPSLHIGAEARTLNDFLFEFLRRHVDARRFFDQFGELLSPAINKAYFQANPKVIVPQAHLLSFLEIDYSLF